MLLSPDHKNRLSAQRVNTLYMSSFVMYGGGKVSSNS